MRIKSSVCVILSVILLSSCTSYKTKYAGFRPPEAYPGHQVSRGVTIGAEAYANKKEAQHAFGFDIKGAGLLPAQIVLDNKGGQSLELVGAQSFLIDKDDRYWNLIPTSVAIDRLEKSTQLAAFFGKGAGKGAVIGAVAGSLLGAALGIVSGKNVGESLGKGAAIGGVAGAAVGSVKEGTSGEREQSITEDMRSKGIEGKVIPPDHLANGFLFFPGEADSAKELRLQFKEQATGKIIAVALKLK